MNIAQHHSCINSKDTQQNDTPLLEYHEGNLIGKNPENVDIFEMKAAGHTNDPLAKIIREKCLDCCGFQQSEVRKCVCITCPLWPYRMGKNPFQAAKCKSKPGNLNKAEG